LPINGLNTGEISGLYPNFFVPSGFTFSIWGVIYLLLIIYNIAFTYYILHPQKDKQISAYINSINPLFLLTCLFNASWIVAWHYLQPFLSIIIMLLFLVTLAVLFFRTISFYPSFSLYNRFILHLPFVVYLGWISVATIANITAGLVKWEWAGFGISGIAWSSIMMVVAILLGIFFTYRYKVFSFALVIAWALWGIHESQYVNSIYLAWIPIIGIALLFLNIIYILLTKKATPRIL
jgi:hypothetical protein